MKKRRKLLSIFKCPISTCRKKPFKSLRALNTHISKSHPDFDFKLKLTSQLQAYRKRK